MSAPTGTWQINANGFRGELVIGSVDAQGNLSGTALGDPIVGFWEETSQKITFVRGSNPTDPSLVQIYTGFHFDANEPLFPGGATVQPPVPPFQVRILTGSFEAFARTGGAASRSTFGWMARMTV